MRQIHLSPNVSATIRILSALDEGKSPRKELKILASSLHRSLFTGAITVTHSNEYPLFRSERKQIHEVQTYQTESDTEEREDSLADWVIMAECGGIALRNPDHLFPSRSVGRHHPNRPDMLLLGLEGRAGKYSSGLWAVNGRYANEVLEGWNRLRKSTPVRENTDIDALWTEYAAGLGLRKQPFEKGEVLAPDVRRLDWWSVSNAAFITLRHWPEAERWKMLQALYFSTYFGDPSGMMVDILEP